MKKIIIPTIFILMISLVFASISLTNNILPDDFENMSFKDYDWDRTLAYEISKDVTSVSFELKEYEFNYNGTVWIRNYFNQNFTMKNYCKGLKEIDCVHKVDDFKNRTKAFRSRFLERRYEEKKYNQEISVLTKQNKTINWTTPTYKTYTEDTETIIKWSPKESDNITQIE